MSNTERLRIQASWNTYEGEGKKLMQMVLKNFIKKYRGIPNLKISPKLGILMGGGWAISVEYPFIFDCRKIPKTYLGIEVRSGTPAMEMPKEFQVNDTDTEYVWAPERFEAFVDRCAEEIRKKLGDPNMSRDDMLDALCFGDFKAHVAHCRESGKEGRIPRFRSKG